VSIGLNHDKNPFLAVLGPFIMSFFEFGRQILKLINRKKVVPPVQTGRSGLCINGAIVFFVRSMQRICESMIDSFTPQPFLIVIAISQLVDWMRNGNGEKFKK
jgi:hypothetical protein